MYVEHVKISLHLLKYDERRMMFSFLTYRKISNIASPQPIFSFCVYDIHSDIQYMHPAISGLLQPAWIATRKLFILHTAMVSIAQIRDAKLL